MFGPKKIFGLKKMLSPKFIFSPKQYWVKKNFWAPWGIGLSPENFWVFQFLSLKKASVPNLSLPLSLEPFEKFLVVGGWWWVGGGGG